MVEKVELSGEWVVGATYALRNGEHVRCFGKPRQGSNAVEFSDNLTRYPNGRYFQGAQDPRDVVEQVITTKADRLPPEYRVPFMEFPWMGHGLSEEQRKGVSALLDALEHYAAGPDPGMALMALRVEGARREHHASILGKYVPPLEPEGP